MTSEEIDKIYPKFKDWCRKKGYMTVDGIHLLKLWYEYIESIDSNEYSI